MGHEVQSGGRHARNEVDGHLALGRLDCAVRLAGRDRVAFAKDLQGRKQFSSGRKQRERHNAL
jgi:hypothetical protein